MKNKLIEQWKIDEEKSFEGWDFSYLDNRWEEDPLPWDYESLIKKYLKPEDQLLDMGTGGGEFLLRLKHPYDNTSVTEAYEPNYKLCLKKLKPLGIRVKKIPDDDSVPCTTILPFEDNAFDIILSRHESYNIKEIMRVLKPGGLFITQQVGGNNNVKLSKKLVEGYNHLYENLNLKNTVIELENEEFEILYKNECLKGVRFFDVGAIVYFAKVIEWEFPGFSVASCQTKLFELNKVIEESGFYKSLQYRLVVVSRKH